MDWLWYVLHIKVLFPGAHLKFLGTFLGNKGVTGTSGDTSELGKCLEVGWLHADCLMGMSPGIHLCQNSLMLIFTTPEERVLISWQLNHHPPHFSGLSFFFYGIKQCALINWSHQEKEPITYFIFKVLKNSVIRKMRISYTGQAEWKAKACNL